MDPVINPYVPGAGISPREVVGGELLIDLARIAFERAKAGRHARGFIAVGLRGVGKTVMGGDHDHRQVLLRGTTDRHDKCARIRPGKVLALGPVRQALIAKGTIYSPAHGDAAFTVPVFDQFLKRTMPGWAPPKGP